MLETFLRTLLGPTRSYAPIQRLRADSQSIRHQTTKTAVFPNTDRGQRLVLGSDPDVCAKKT